MKPALLLLFLTVSTLHAQRPACADSVSQRLGTLIGTWDVRSMARQGPTAWDTTTGIAEIRPDFEGCLLREQFTGRRYGQPFNFLSLWGAVGLNHPIQRTFVHSQHGLLGVYSGAVSNGRLALRDSQVVNGQLMHFEHRFEPFPAADSMRFSSLRSTDRGATWLVTWYADYRRRTNP